jgi:hypothetical protein
VTACSHGVGASPQGQESAAKEVAKRGDKLIRRERECNTAKILEAVLWRDSFRFDALVGVAGDEILEFL